MIAAFVAAVALADPQFTAFGSASCGAWMSGRLSESEVRAYVMGFWSGRNSGLIENVGTTTDGDGLVEEVRLVCRATPSKDIVTATVEVYQRFQSEGR